MKQPLFLFLLLACSFCAYSQEITGIYRGTMTVDSPRNTIDFELTLKEVKGKYTGYCYRLFIVGDTLYYNVVRVNARINKDVLVVEDEESVSNNFERTTKGIKTVFFFKLPPATDTVRQATGEWTTTVWRRYLPLTGKVTIQREPDPKTTQLYKRLSEKKLEDALVFEAPKPRLNKTTAATLPPAKEPIATIITKPGISSLPTPTDSLVTAPTAQANALPAPVTATPATTATVATGSPAAAPTNQPETKPVRNPPTTAAATNSTKQQPTNTPTTTTTNPSTNKPTTTVAAGNAPAKPTAPDVTTTPNPSPQQTTKPVTTATTPATPQPVAAASTNKLPASEPSATTPSITRTGAATTLENNRETRPARDPKVIPTISNPVLTKRETELIQTLDILEDSVTLSLYDNGEVDGDVVSVFLNNEEIISKVSLSATAYKKTIYLPKGETARLTLYAENLGSVPPNTGLLVVYSGDQRYQVFFTATLSKNAFILLRHPE